MHRTCTTRQTYKASRLGMETYENVKPADVQVFTHPVFGNIVTAFPVTVNDEFAEQRVLKMKRYELNSHLGNVLVTVSDRKLAVDANTNGTVDYYLADVISYNDYYPGHALMPGRHGNSNAYRYGGANGQEKVDEVSGEGNHYTAEYWEYDPRTIRRWQTDPVVKPHESPYACFANNPVFMIDPAGDNAGDYYKSDGTYLGSDGYSDDKVYTAKGVDNSKTGKERFKGAKDLGIKHSVLIDVAATAYGESSVGVGEVSFPEMNGIASVVIRHPKSIAYARSKSGYKTFISKSNADRSKSYTMRMAMSAAIFATMGVDFSNGADSWDGVDQAIIPGNEATESRYGNTYHSHAAEYGWTIRDFLYKKWEKAVLENPHFGKNSFVAPQHKKAIGAPGYEFNKGLYRKEATAQWGLSIFWKDNPDPTKNVSERE